MRNNMTYGLRMLSAGLLAVAMIGCTGKEGGEGEGKETTETSAIVEYVSTLTDKSLMDSESDYSEIRSFVKTLYSDGKAPLVLLDRTDGAAKGKVAGIALDNTKWTSFAMYRQSSEDSFEGSSFIFQKPTRNVYNMACGSGCHIAGLDVALNGNIIRKDPDGNIISQKTVEAQAEMYNVNFSTSEQVAAFGGESGVFRSLVSAKKNLVMLGTVKNEDFETLKGAVAAVDASYVVSELKKGTEYTLFMLGSKRYWRLNGVSETPLSNGIVSYSVDLRWM